MNDMGWTKYYQNWEWSEFAKVCEEERRKNGLIVSDKLILKCKKCELCKNGLCEI